MMSYPRVNRVLHALFALMMVFQLISEELMKRPKLVDGVPRERTAEQIQFFELHELFGILLLIIVGVRFSLLLGNADDMRRLFPYFSAARMKGVMDELKGLPGWLAGKIPSPTEADYLSGLVHGLGLLLGLALGITGTVMYVGMDPINGTMNGFVHLLKETHEILGELLFYYVIGHVGMAIVHQLKGHRSFQRISPLAKE